MAFTWSPPDPLYKGFPSIPIVYQIWNIWIEIQKTVNFLRAKKALPPYKFLDGYGIEDGIPPGHPSWGVTKIGTTLRKAHWDEITSIIDELIIAFEMGTVISILTRTWSNLPSLFGYNNCWGWNLIQDWRDVLDELVVLIEEWKSAPQPIEFNSVNKSALYYTLGGLDVYEPVHIYQSYNFLGDLGNWTAPIGYEKSTNCEDWKRYIKPLSTSSWQLMNESASYHKIVSESKLNIYCKTVGHTVPYSYNGTGYGLAWDWNTYASMGVGLNIQLNQNDKFTFFLFPYHYQEGSASFNNAPMLQITAVLKGKTGSAYPYRYLNYVLTDNVHWLAEVLWDYNGGRFEYIPFSLSSGTNTFDLDSYIEEYPTLIKIAFTTQAGAQGTGGYPGSSRIGWIEADIDDIGILRT